MFHFVTSHLICFASLDDNRTSYVLLVVLKLKAGKQIYCEN
jgi:hypothetical protein